MDGFGGEVMVDKPGTLIRLKMLQELKITTLMDSEQGNDIRENNIFFRR